MWISGIIASLSSITYPAISAYISTYADSDKQGLVQGLITGVRSLCTGIGPALFGLLFYIFDVDIYEEIKANPYSPHTAQDPLKPFMSSAELTGSSSSSTGSNTPIGTHHHHLSGAGKNVHPSDYLSSWIVGPPFLFGAILVLLAAITATFIPDTIMPYRRNAHKSSSDANFYRYTTVSSSSENGFLTLANNNGNGLNSAEAELLEQLED